MTRAPPPGLLELSPVERGVVSIFGVASRFFVAMSNKGKLYGSVSTAGPTDPRLGSADGILNPLQAEGTAGLGQLAAPVPHPVP